MKNLILRAISRNRVQPPRRPRTISSTTLRAVYSRTAQSILNKKGLATDKKASQTLGEVVGEDARGFVPSGNLCGPRY